MLRFTFDKYDTETIEAMKVIFGEDDVNEMLLGENGDMQYTLELELRRH